MTTMLDVYTYITSRHFVGYRLSRGMAELCHDDQPYEPPDHASEMSCGIEPVRKLKKGLRRYCFSGKRPSGVSVLLDRVEGRSLVYPSEVEARKALRVLNAGTKRS